MNQKIKLFVNVIFCLICLGATLTCVTISIRRWMLNEDICRISFKRFNGGPEQVYPTISICIFNPIFEYALNKFVNISNPRKLLHEWYLQEVLLGTELRNVTFDDITLDINQYLLDYDVLLLNQNRVSYKTIKDVEWKGPYVSLRDPQTKCFSFDIPYKLDKNIQGIAITLRPSLFNNDTRPDIINLRTDTRGIALSMHMKSQLILSYANMQTTWTHRGPGASKFYGMTFALNSMDVLVNRNKRTRNETCLEEWYKYDETFYNAVVEHLGCQPDYWMLNSTVDRCSKKNEYDEVLALISEALSNSLSAPQPCKLIKQLQYDYLDVDGEIYQRGITITVDFKKLNLHYKEIKQVEAFNFESLIGKYS